MFSRVRNTSLAAIAIVGGLATALSPIAAEAGDNRHGANRHGNTHHWNNSGHYRGGGSHHEKRRWIQRHNRHRQAASPVNFDLSGDRTVFGGLIGAVLGATLGSQIGKGSGNTAAIVGGGVLGALIGGTIGRGMDQTDQMATARVLETSPTGNSVTWRNASTGSSYEVTPVRTYQAPDNRVCRDFSSWAVIDGYEEQLHGTACRMPDGSWKRAG